MTSDSAASSDARPPVFARPKSDFYGFVILLALCGLAVMIAAFFAWRGGEQPQLENLWFGLAAVFVAFMLPCLAMLWLMRRLCVVADARGLWIRGAFKTRFLAWRSIEDYELRPSSRSETFHLVWICYQGKWQRLPQAYGNMNALRTRIQHEATASRARDWQLNIEREEAEQWPKTYVYPDPSGRKGYALVVAALLFVCVAVVSNNFGLSTETARAYGDELERWVHLAIALVPILLLLVPHTAIYLAKKRVGSQIIRADPHGLTRIEAQIETRIAWNEITDYFVEEGNGTTILPQFVVQSAGERIVFRQEISDFGELKALVQARATGAASDGWRRREEFDSDVLGGATTLRADNGRKTHHYRTRTVRAMLVLGGFILLVLLIGNVSAQLRRGWQTSDLWVWLLFFLPVLVLTLGGALAFWRASIQTDENGITQRGIWSERALKWDEIESFIFYDYFYQIKGAGTVIRWGAVAASESLRAEIEARTGLKMGRNGQPGDDE